ncbi:MAG: DUF1284 domain-containing protein [Oscillospiraceae bacterium]|nr:DUF1284 domain-containing protein [Oscillospiraceae bacterium]
MKQLKLRYHHLMCCYTFTGVGYSEAFTQNMEQAVSLLHSGEPLEIRLQSSCDDLCAACPHHADGLCDEEDSVRARDREVAAFFGLEENDCLSFPEYRQEVLAKQKELTDISEVCRECTFTALCREVLLKKNAETAAGIDSSQ